MIKHISELVKKILSKVKQKSAERELYFYNRPEIRLSGEWLRKSGFEIGDYIRIAYDNAVIVIKKTGGVNETQE